MVKRIIKGEWAETMFREINGENISDNKDLVDALEKRFADDIIFRKLSLPKEKYDYAVFFVSPTRDMVFLLWKLNDELYLIDKNEIPNSDIDIVEHFVNAVAEYLSNIAFSLPYTIEEILGTKFQE